MVKKISNFLVSMHAIALSAVFFVSPAFAHGLGFAIVFFAILGLLGGSVAGCIAAFITDRKVALKYLLSLILFLLLMLSLGSDTRSDNQQWLSGLSLIFNSTFFQFTISWFTFHWIGGKFLTWYRRAASRKQDSQ